jgi:hypothetical protein
MGNPTWVNLLDPHPIVRGVAKNTFTTFADISPAPVPQVYAGELKIGSKIDVEAWGEFSTTGTPTLSIGVWYGAVTSNWASAVAATGSGAASWPWHLHWSAIVTAISASTGTIYGHGILDISNTGLDNFIPRAVPITAAARQLNTLDTTVLKQIGVGAAWGTSNAANSITCDVLNVKLMNQGKT